MAKHSDEAKEIFAREMTRMRQVQAEMHEGALEAIVALEGLLDVMAEKTGQSYTVRALLYSLWNGQLVSLLGVVTLDWRIRQRLVKVILAFGYESRDQRVTFFYDHMKEVISRRGLWDWFEGAHQEAFQKGEPAA